jgi:hypothetical protein
VADYMVGKGGGGKDRYMVGANQAKGNIYKVGGGGSNPGQADNAQLGKGDQDPVVGSKSAFDYKADTDKTYKDIGDAGDNSNFGGGQSGGPETRRTGAGGEIELSYTEKGDFSMEKDAMARRKARADGYKQVMSGGNQYKSPVLDGTDGGPKD